MAKGRMEHLNVDRLVGETRGTGMQTIRRSDAIYPGSLGTYHGGGAPERIFAFGDLNILRGKMLALFCSVRCQGTRPQDL